jgi:hypothetical protein
MGIVATRSKVARAARVAGAAPALARWLATALMMPLVPAMVLVPGPARAEVVGGVQLPDGASKVAENRYKVSKDFDDTLKYYKTAYPKESYPRKAIINQPGVKAVHIVNPSGRNFEGLNIYEANDEVRIYIVPTADSAKPKKPKKKKGSGSATATG